MEDTDRVVIALLDSGSHDGSHGDADGLVFYDTYAAIIFS